MEVHTVEAERLLSSRRRLLASAGPAGPAGVSADTRVQLTEIDAALARIADGTFGTCEACGGAIGRDRLRALPEVRRCLACSGTAARR